MIHGNLGKFSAQKQKGKPPLVSHHHVLQLQCTKVQCADVLALPPSQTGYTLNP